MCIYLFTHTHVHVSKINIFLPVHLANTAWFFKAHLQLHHPPHEINLSLVKALTAPFIAPIIFDCPDFRELYLSLHSQHLAKYLIYSKWSINAAFSAFWSATIKTRVLSCMALPGFTQLQSNCPGLRVQLVLSNRRELQPI